MGRRVPRSQHLAGSDLISRSMAVDPRWTMRKKKKWYSTIGPKLCFLNMQDGPFEKPLPKVGALTIPRSAGVWLVSRGERSHRGALECRRGKSTGGPRYCLQDLISHHGSVVELEVAAKPGSHECSCTSACTRSDPTGTPQYTRRVGALLCPPEQT